MKKCSKCGLEKELNNFHNDKTRTDGKYVTCVDCYNSSKRVKYLEKHPEFAARKDRIDRTPSGFKYCHKCDSYILLENFYKRKDSPDGLRTYCKRCILESNEASPSSIEKKNKSDNFVRKTRTTYLKTRHKLTTERYHEILLEQNGMCAICSISSSEYGKLFAIDHDHNCCPGKFTCGKCVRGLLCTKCNASIGALGDNSSGVLKALKYLQSYENGIIK